MVTYLDTGGAAQNASMTLLKTRSSKDVSNKNKDWTALLKSWPSRRADQHLAKEAYRYSTGKTGFYEYQKQRLVCTLHYFIKPTLILCYLCLNSALWKTNMTSTNMQILYKSRTFRIQARTTGISHAFPFDFLLHDPLCLTHGFLW